jgi:hypothetical protein
MKYAVEYTDTFAGEANYSWVRRAIIEAPANAAASLIMRRAKKALGLSGARGRTIQFGEVIEFRPHGRATVLFVSEHFGG